MNFKERNLSRIEWSQDSLLGAEELIIGLGKMHFSFEAIVK